MRGGDPHSTNRASFVVPSERQNDTLFDFVLWQVPKPGGSSEGGTSGGQMVYFDGTPSGDVVVGGYHWPKGVMAIDRRTGSVLWSENPAGGESIGRNTPAFSPDGSTVYVTNDATPGHPLMAFPVALGPSAFHSNAGQNDPDAGSWSPFVLPNGQIIVSDWCDSVAGFEDTGSSLSRAWTGSGSCSCYPTAAADEQNGMIRVLTSSRCGSVTCYDGSTGAELWRTPVGLPTDAGITVDPDTGNLYIPLGQDSIEVASLDASGLFRWGGPTRVFNHEPGTNEPQRAQSSGALSHDGSTFYFQTVAQDGSGALHAIRTEDGSVRWSHPTGSTGWEAVSSSPVVTPNGLLFVGTNGGGRYLALRDEGDSATVLDEFSNAADSPGLGQASCSPTISHDGILYLPVRTAWTVPHADGDAPTGEARHLFAAFDLTEDASVNLPHPAGLGVFAGNASARLTWVPINAPASVFRHYAIYRDTEAFASLAGRTPIGFVEDVAAASYTDAGAANGVSYHYAVASVPTTGEPADAINSVGPRTPFLETDLQVTSIRRTPEYPRYAPTYTHYTVTEPSGYGPYSFTAATGLGQGQTDQTQRWPEIGDSIVYTATVRNRGTVEVPGPIALRWLVDGSVASQTSISQPLAPGETATTQINQAWDGELHTLTCELLGADDRTSNDSLTIGSRSVGFLSFIDETRIEEFREEAVSYPSAITNDKIDWLNAHMARFNQLLEDAGTDKRVHFASLEVIGDRLPDPDVPRINYAIFPFRYHAGEGSLRLSGYYRPADDLDFGLLHEMGHQLGLIDLYQLDLPAERNLVSAQGYTAPDGLMRGVSPFVSEHSANAMQRWLNEAHGYFGQYLYSLPEQVRLKFIGIDGAPLTNASVRVYQKNDVPGQGVLITDQIRHEGVTNADGYFTLPNIDIDQQLVPPVHTGDTLTPNPFGYVAVVGYNGLLLIEVEKDGFTEYVWLDITEVNNAYWTGQTNVATIERQVPLGGEILEHLPPDLAEENASDWSAFAEAASASVADDDARVVFGSASIRFETTGGFDTSLRFPRGQAWLDLSSHLHLRFFAYAENPNIGFQGDVPWVRLLASGGSVDLRPNSTPLNQAIDTWHEFVIPLAGNADWTRTETGTPDLSESHAIELHADTWGYGFTLWLDGVRFTPRSCPADLAPPFGVLDLADIVAFVQWFQAGNPIADIDANGLYDLSDINEFIGGFVAGCP